MDPEMGSFLSAYLDMLNMPSMFDSHEVPIADEQLAEII